MIAANREGIAALNGMADSTESGIGRIVNATNTLVEDIDGIGNLGPHKKSILEMAKRILEAISSASHPASAVAGKLREKAVVYQQFVDNDRFLSGGGQGSFAGGPGYSGGRATNDYETAPETKDSVNPEKSGELAPRGNPYADRWEADTPGWDSLGDVPFARRR